MQVASVRIICRGLRAMAFNHGDKKSSSGLWHLLPTLKVPFLKTTWAIPANKLRDPFSCHPSGFLCALLSCCDVHLASPSCFCVFLFSWSCLRDEEEEEEEEQPITEPNSEEEREDDAQCQGKDRY